ncbi:exosortase A [Rugamonas apoptosis]|uniref:Exosortase A n=1 Tax=Rugamonas apoptosis TaxID=2758570 RepID=A0A7W2IK68_9BURK|nr:exosortase A [Rugamonas apoptosis]MBA5687273.1 exosortase A [Rugamonas apoptosis]
MNRSAMLKPMASDLRTPWPRAALASLLVALAAVMALHAATLAGMVGLWWRSQTYAHGFVVVPVSAWLIWRRRHVLADLAPKPSPPAMALLALLGGGWLLGALAEVPSLQQYMVVAMLGAATAAIAGGRCAREIAFPLAYLLLAVPFGEVLIPPLINFTARFTVTALQLSGVPVLRENNYLTLPNGNWSVVDACSGLRYVIASVALGALYAWLNYRQPVRRLLFVAVSMLLPVLANGVRAYLIVLLGYVSDMRLAVGIDHLIYGWLFFGIVCLLLFWCGRLWREATPAPVRPPPSLTPPAPVADVRQIWRAALYCVAITASWPLLATAMQATTAPPAGAPPRLDIGDPPPPWRHVPWQADDWRLPSAPPALSYAASFGDSIAQVTLQLAWYRQQRRGAELLTAFDPVPRAPGQAAWHESVTSSRNVTLGARRLAVQQLELRAGARRLLVWRWYRQGGTDTASPIIVKLALAKARLLRQPDSGAVIAIAAASDDTADAAAALERFLGAMLPAIELGLRHADQ